MMADTIRIIAGIVLISVGVIFSILSVIGVFRFRYVLNRMHAAAIGDTLAILFVLLGLIVISGLNFTSLKLGVIIVFFWLASPVSSHLISNLVTEVDAKRIDKECKMINLDNKSSETESYNEK